ncbi:glycosyltransferase family 9 protein [Vibrio intestinalis]|uniref:glycosyltransferase family 9 protein n=1 Tax=Vibrio intestinalis TaxID=2933291 RepID=UPI0021A59274|nr:glycosyltransferase family 9 protein [Vibrio intestinalis]
MNVKNILVIRRDNIGDLVCTTPLFESIKTLYPEANVYAYVNTVNAPVLKGNPHVEELFIYKKAKHRDEGESVLSIYWQRFKTILKLRSLNIDTVILANPLPCKHSLKIAKKLGAKNIIGAEIEGDKAITHPFKPEDIDGNHHVENVCSYLKAFNKPIPTLPDIRIYPVDDDVKAMASKAGDLAAEEVVGIHISVRRPKNRWSVENYSKLMHMIAENKQAKFLLFWAPARAEDINDKGDDARAEQVLELTKDLDVVAMPTATVEELIAGFSLCDSVVCGEGGQMHLAAALKKKVLVFFGDTIVERWRPWCQNYQLIKASDDNSDSITADKAYEHYLKL